MAHYERLSVQDASFLSTERAGLPMHVALLAVAEGGPLHDRDGRFRLDAVRQEIARRLHRVPRLRQVVLCPPPGQGLPLWVDDPTFDLANHVHVVELPAPGAEPELLRGCEELYLRLLDRGRPLWELWFVARLADGRVGLMLKLHHAVADGLAAVEIAGALLDTEPDAPSPTSPPWSPRPAPSGWALFADNLRGRGTALAATLVRLLHPRKTALQARAIAGAVRMGLGGRRGPPRSWLHRPVGGRRRLALVRARLAGIKEIAHAHDAKVNDVVLAAVAGGLRAVVVAAGRPVDGLILRASVPVSLRAPGGAAALGNQAGLMVVPLPVGEPDPVERLRRVAGATAERKRRPDSLASLRPVGSLTVMRMIDHYIRHQRIIDLLVTNVPGPQFPLYVLGARLLEAFPVVVIAGNVPLSVGVLSYDGQLDIGIQTDPDGFPDLDVFADGLRRSLDELAAAAVRSSAPVRRDPGPAPETT